MEKLSEAETEAAQPQPAPEPARGGGGPAHGDVDGHAQRLGRAGGNRGAMLQQLHATFGNAFVQEVLDRLEQGVGSLPDDRAGAIAKLDEVASTQLAAVNAQVATGAGTNTQPLKTAPPPKTTATPDRAVQEAKIRAAGSKERRELDTALDGELASLDRVLDAELGRIDHQADAQLRATEATVAEDQKHLDHDVSANDRANHKQVTAAKTAREAEVAAQKATLHETGEGERGFQQATHDDIIKDSVNPHVTAQNAAIKATAGTQPSAVRMLGGATSTQAQTATQRAQAKTITDGQAAAVEAEGARLTTQVAADGTALTDKQDKRTALAIADVTKEEKRQEKRIDSASGRAASEMKSIAGKAHDDMAAASAQFATDAQASGATARDTIENARAAAKARATQLRTETAQRIRDTHAREKAEVDSKVLQLLGDLAATPDSDLHRMEATFAKELRKLDGIDRATESEMHGTAVGAENTLADEDQERMAAIKAAGTQARAAIAAYYDEAKKQIAAVEKPADAELAAAAKRGKASVAAVGKDASKDLTAFSDKRYAAEVKAAEADLEAFDTNATAANKSLVDMANGITDKIGGQWADDAMPGITAVFDKGDPVASLRALTALPLAARGPAVDKLTHAQFQVLLKQIPEGNREELASLVPHTHNPKRKLELWGVFHKTHAMNDAKNDGAAADPESQRRHAARMNAATTTQAEVDDEVSFLEHRKKPLTEAAVDSLIARKDKEHAMEMKYNVNFTNDTKLRKDGTHVHWRQDQLEALDNVMGRMPEDHMAGNANLTEMHRQEIVYWGDPKDNVQVGGLATGTQVLIPDNATNTWPDAETRELAPATMTPEVSWMEWLTTHELGHNVSNKKGDVYEKYREANGWESYAKDTDELTADEKKTLEAKRKNKDEDRARVEKDGKTYLIDQDGDGYISYTQGAVPDERDSQEGKIGKKDPWSYARTRDFEQFAEHYTRAMHVPERVYKDLIETPHKATEVARAELAAATTAGDKADKQAKVSRLEKAEQARKQSFFIMRDEVFGTAKAQQDAEARLKARGIDTTEFNKQAAHASTPDQIATIEAKFR